MLLQMIKECHQASGYDIKKLIDQRGYKEWANIGTTSIYTGLKKLRDKGWIVSEEPTEKSGKGPMPNRFALTKAGVDRLKWEVIDSLSSARARDSRFDLGLAALPFVEKDEAVEALQSRLNMLQVTSKKIEERYEAQGGARLPLNVRALFQHSLNFMESEQAFVVSLIKELLEETNKYEQHH
jgi:DNA-binding PadR family transcriptional regulator